MTIDLFNYIQATFPDIWHNPNTYDIIQDFINEEDKYYKSIKPKALTKYKVIESFDKELLLTICNEKIISNEDVDIFLELRSFLTLDDKHKIPQIKIDYANEVPLQVVLNELWLHHRRWRMICPYCWNKDNSKFSFKDNLWRCWGECGRKWNTISFIKEHLWLTWKESVIYLSKF